MSKPSKHLTTKQIIDIEYRKCAKDPVYFMKKYCRIQHPMKGKINFNLFPFQEDLLTDLTHNRFNIILKGRQLGISTISAAFALWKMTFISDYNVLVIATSQDVAKNLVTKVRVMYDNLPSWLKAKYAEHNKLSLRFQNGSQIKAASANSEAGRSEALSLLVIDEAAFISNVETIWTAAQPTLSAGGSSIVLSTPNGSGNFFHKQWEKALEDKAKGKQDTMNPIRLPWHVHPERDQSWRDLQDDLVGEKQAAQENDCDFITSGHTVVEGTILDWYEKTFQEDPAETRGIDGNYWIWEYPDYSRDYMVVADVARGDGSDNSAFHVIDVESCTQVAEYKGQIGTTDYGNFLVEVATAYNGALLSIENATVGWAVIQIAMNRKYPNLYYTLKQPNYIDDKLHVAFNHDIMDESKLVPGFTMSTKTRPLVISKLEAYFLDKTPIIRSRRTIGELKVFIWNGHKAMARNGFNDDLVMALGQGFFLRDTALKLRQRGIDMMRKSLKSMHKPIYTSSDNKKHPYWNQRIGNHDEDFRWLL